MSRKAAKPNLSLTQKKKNRESKNGELGGRGGDTANMHWQTNWSSFCFLQVKLYPPVRKQPTSRYAIVLALSQSDVIYKQVKRTACVVVLRPESAQVQSEALTAIFCLYPGVKAEEGCRGMCYSFINESGLLNRLGSTSKESNRFYAKAELCLRQMLISLPLRLHADKYSKKK